MKRITITNTYIKTIEVSDDDYEELKSGNNSVFNFISEKEMWEEVEWNCDTESHTFEDA